MTPDSTQVSGGTRDAAGRFLPGTSGNKGGRRKTLSGLVRKSTKDGKDVVAFLTRVLKGQEPKVTIADRLRAAELLCDRGWGRTRPTGDADVDVNVGVGVLVLPEPVSAEQWSGIAQIQQRKLMKDHMEG